MKNSNPPVEEEVLPSNAFAHTLNQISHGQLAEQASEELARLVAAIQETGKKGKLVLTINIKPRGRDSGQVEVVGDVKVTCPTSEIAPVMLFADANGNLVKDNPKQMKLQFDQPRPVSKAASQ